MNEQHTTAKDFFIHLGALIALYVSVISLINLLFAIINIAFPDAVSTYYAFGVSGELYTVRWTVSSLVILFPLYIYLARTITKDKKDIWVRRWSKYLTLFLTGGVMIGDLIAVINVFLGGEISVRFLLKVLVILIVAGFTFYYYVKDSHAKPNLLIGIASAIVFLSVVGGFLAIGTPATQRAQQFDQQRVNDLQGLVSEIKYYARETKVLPASLAEIRDASTMYPSITDPETKQEYEYIIKSPSTFAVCAVFSTENKLDYWPHGTGRVCFDQSAVKDLSVQ